MIQIEKSNDDSFVVIRRCHHLKIEKMKLCIPEHSSEESNYAEAIQSFTVSCTVCKVTESFELWSI